LSLLRERLANPFFAMLLEPSNDGRFRRISTREHIVAKLDPPPRNTEYDILTSNDVYVPIGGC